MTDLPERDPLADLVSRSIGAHVPSVAVEELPTRDGVERKRLRYDTAAGGSSVIFERSARGVTIEAQLLPFLARKTPHVPVVHSRGLPPPHASLGPWLLLEDADAAPPACDGDPADVLAAMRAIARATATDVPALRALGLRPRADLPEPLASAPLALVHGDLTCARARRLERGVVVTAWSHAFLGPAVIDAVSLANDLERHGDRASAARIRDLYVSESGVASSKEHWEAAALRLA